MKKLFTAIFCFLTNVFMVYAAYVGPAEKLLLISATNYMYTANAADQTFFYLGKDSHGNRTIFTIGNRDGDAGDYSFAFGEYPIAAGLFSHAEGYYPSAINDYSYVWSGDTKVPQYSDHGVGTYNVNPVNGLKGFFIGEYNLYDYIITNTIPLLVQSDWNETNTNDLAFIKNKPTIPTNLSDLGDVNIENADENQVLTYDENSETWKNKAIDFPPQQQVDWKAQSGITSILNKPDLKPVATSGVYNDLTGKPSTVTLTLNVTKGQTTTPLTFNVLSVNNEGQTQTLTLPDTPALGDLTNVKLATPPNNGQLLTYRDGNWTNETLNIPTPTSTLSDLTDVNLSQQLSGGQVLVFDGDSEKWINETITVGDTVSYTNELEGENKIKVGYLTIDGDTNNPVYAPVGGGGVSTVEWDQKISDGTEIATLTIDGNDPIHVKVPNNYVQKSGDTMTGPLTNTTSIIVGEGASNDEHSKVFVFNGGSGSYSAPEDGSFSANPANGLEGFYIGESNVYQIVFERLLNIITDKQYSQAKNVDELISNEKDLWDAITEFADYNNTLRTATTDKPVETRDVSQPLLLGASGSTSSIFTNSYFDGHYETNNIMAFYPFYSIGQKFLNFGVDGSAGNVSMFGLTDRWTGTDPNSPPPGNNEVCEAMRVGTDGFTRSGASSISSYDPLGSTNKFTIMAWVYRNNDYSASRILADLAGTTKGDGFQIRFAGSSGTIRLFINPNDSNDYAESAGTISPSSKKWHHVAISFDSSREGTLEDRTVNFFVDGEKKNKPQSQANYKQGDAGIVAANIAPFTLGCASGADSYNQQLLGLLDDVIIFRGWTPLDYTEIINPATGLNWSENEIVQFWMNMNDSILGKPDVSGLGVNFGQFDPAESIYNVQEVNKLLGITEERAEEIIGHEPTTFGQTDPRTSIYGAEEIEDLYDEYYHP